MLRKGTLVRELQGNQGRGIQTASDVLLKKKTRCDQRLLDTLDLFLDVRFGQVGWAVSTDGGVVFVIRHLQESVWFKRLVPSLREGIAEFEGQRYGHARAENLERGLVARIARLAMGYPQSSNPEAAGGCSVASG